MPASPHGPPRHRHSYRHLTSYYPYATRNDGKRARWLRCLAHHRDNISGRRGRATNTPAANVPAAVSRTLRGTTPMPPAQRFHDAGIYAPATAGAACSCVLAAPRNSTPPPALLFSWHGSRTFILLSCHIPCSSAGRGRDILNILIPTMTSCHLYPSHLSPTCPCSNMPLATMDNHFHCLPLLLWQDISCLYSLGWQEGRNM